MWSLLKMSEKQMEVLKLGLKLKEARLEAGLDQRTAAEALGIHQGKISLIEKGARKVDAATELPIFAEVYKKPISWFFEDNTNIPQDESEVDSFLKRYLPDVEFTEFEKKRLSQFLGSVLDTYVKSDPELKKKVNDKE